MDITPADKTRDLIGCPNCDQLYRVRPIEDGTRATCTRCHTVLIAPVCGQPDLGVIGGLLPFP